jgi:hypothetical protein
MKTFTEALDVYLEAKRELDKRRKHYTHDWDYFCEDEIRAVEKAAAELNAFFKKGSE